MGLTTQDVGVIYGTFGCALTIGGILGGIVISRDGLGKWMLP
jgi:PAT family beta-lactamase induction signal transducer AmpG